MGVGGVLAMETAKWTNTTTESLKTAFTGTNGLLTAAEKRISDLRSRFEHEKKLYDIERDIAATCRPAGKRNIAVDPQMTFGLLSVARGIGPLPKRSYKKAVKSLSILRQCDDMLEGISASLQVLLGLIDRMDLAVTPLADAHIWLSKKQIDGAVIVLDVTYKERVLPFIRNAYAYAEKISAADSPKQIERLLEGFISGENGMLSTKRLLKEAADRAYWTDIYEKKSPRMKVLALLLESFRRTAPDRHGTQKAPQAGTPADSLAWKTGRRAGL